MSTTLLWPRWRSALVSAALSVVSAATLLPTASMAQADTDEVNPIRAFKVNVPEAQLVELQKRVNATRWPDRETVDDQSQGPQLLKLQQLIRYWGTDYDWRRAEARLNALPQFVTEIDGLDIHFIHVRSPHPNALPLIITHGWPGSVLEQLKVIEPLTNPTAYGGRAEDAFDVVIPSMPGYGFSERPTRTGWDPEHMGRAWDVLMKRLGYTRYVAQGGDWGSVVADAMGRQAPPGLLGIHVNMPATVPKDAAKALNNGDPAPKGLSAPEKAAFDQLDSFFRKNAGYGAIMATRPQAVGYALSDSPAGLAAWFYDKFSQWTYSGGDPERALTKDEMLDGITLYWLTNTAVSSARLYWENNNNNFSSPAQRTTEIKVPVAVTVFAGEIYRAPKSWTQRAYPTLIYFNEVSKGGHFAAWEEPALFSAELRAAFRPLR
ncbi:epoxide hydrolase [Variovorax sp. J22R133]|uniref:epoxide hydrolase family protein n=1 Tax=Variovorax brevis TaxID=3053503 RepID=UPI0025770E9B|nr:epoxide hydrolase family protein [Variovorax sp. J22R133]MDM0117488.1 epoxide hydrolase [Variovorax sp. J22R133]